MGGVSGDLARELRDAVGLTHAVETGTYLGGGTRLLAGIFGEVATIELSEELHSQAVGELADLGGVRALQGDSRSVLPTVVRADTPGLYFLDGHWSGGPTAGEGAECPVLDELDALAAGHPDDCILIDDARFFAAPPPPPHDPAQWPTLVETFDALRRIRPGHHVTLLGDQVIAVPERARAVVDAYGQALEREDDAPAPPPPGGPLGFLRRRA